MASRGKTRLLAHLTSPLFFRHFLSQDALGVYPVTLSLWGRLSLLGADFRRGASCELAGLLFGKRQKPAILGVKSKAPKIALPGLFLVEPSFTSALYEGVVYRTWVL